MNGQQRRMLMRVKNELRRLLGIFLCLGMVLVLMPTELMQLHAETKPNYLTFTAQEAGSTISLTWDSGSNVQCSIDRGATWKNYVKNTIISLNNVGDSVQFRGENVRINTTSISSTTGFAMSGKIAASGSVTSLLDSNGGNPDIKVPDNAFGYMFGNCTSLTSAPELPALSVGNSSYKCMFYNCTSLQTAPELPATSLAKSCYGGMFRGCYSLQTAPKLPTKELATQCYEYMFWGCTSLQTAPELPATKLTAECYAGMFWECTSLQTAPELPATKLAADCYYNMFYGCTSLQIAPELPATELAYRCYCCMFMDCTSLKVAPELPATIMYEECYECMFARCDSLTVVPELPATKLAKECYKNMFRECNNLSITKEKDSEHTLEWKLPASEAADDWNSFMFYECGDVEMGDKGEPQLNTTYYQRCQHSYGSDGKCIYCGEINSDAESSQPSMIEGNNGKYTAGNSEKLSFRSDALFSEFKAVLVDGVKIDSSNYELEAGSIIVRLKPEYLNTLSVGTHTIGIESVNGTATAQFTIIAASNPEAENETKTDPASEQSSEAAQDDEKLSIKSPDTGDESLVSCVVLVIIMLGGAAVLISDLRKNHKNTVR